MQNWGYKITSIQVGRAAGGMVTCHICMSHRCVLSLGCVGYSCVRVCGAARADAELGLQDQQYTGGMRSWLIGRLLLSQMHAESVV
jgi:hypothetical protein